MRKALAILMSAMALATSGCGYRPLYGTSSESVGVAPMLASVSIPEAETRAGQLIRNDLISAMRAGTGEDRYVLVIATSIRKSEQIEKPQPSVTREAIRLQASFTLTDKQTGETLQSGKTFAQASFDVVRQPFADMQAETNATERAAREVSADIRTRLAAYFATRS